mgnify:CR=1 FL=1
MSYREIHELFVVCDECHTSLSVYDATYEGADNEAAARALKDAMTAAAAQKRTQTEADCKAMVERAEQEVQQRWQAFDHKANELLDQYRSTDGLPSEET